MSEINRAIELLNLAAIMLDKHCADRLIRYDETLCDGACLAADCRITAAILASEGK